MSQVSIIQEGAFDGTVRRQINANFTALSQTIPDWYIYPQAGSDSNPGTRDQPFASLTPLTEVLASTGSTRLQNGQTIGLFGVLKQNWVAPALQDVTIVGLANTPRQATSSGTPNGGGATWMNPGTVAEPLIVLGETSTTAKVQGWRFVNIFFGNAGDAPCVKLHRKITGADPSHASFYGCKFSGADCGIQNIESGFGYVIGCEFFNFSGSGDNGIESIAGDGVALPLQWVIQGNRFWNNYGHIVAPFSSAIIQGNFFSWKGSSITTTVQVHLDVGGKNNIVMDNYFQLAESAGTATMFGGGTDDGWFNRYADGAVAGVPI